jgi:hypothetical protein
VADVDIDLSFVTTRALLDELFRRHDAVVVAMERKAKGGVDGSDTFTVMEYYGGMSTALGLVARLRYDILRKTAVGREDEGDEV